MHKLTIKKRIKRAIAAFCREELMEYIGYNHQIPLMPLPDRFNVNRIDFDTLVLEQIVPVEIDRMRMDGNTDSYERLLINAKDKFAREVMKNIHVDAQDLVKDEMYGRRSIKLILRIQRVVS